MVTYRYVMLQFSREYDWQLCTAGYYDRQDTAARASERALTDDSAVAVVTLFDDSKTKPVTRGDVPADIEARVKRAVEIVRDYERWTARPATRSPRRRILAARG